MTRTAPACAGTSGAALFLAALACACTPRAPAPPQADSSQPTVTIARAQTAVDEWTQGNDGPSRDGSAVVVALHETPDHTFATAELKVKSFPDEDGHTSPTEDPAQAVFSHRNDGTWSLTVVVWDAGRRVANPNVVLP